MRKMILVVGLVVAWNGARAQGWADAASWARVAEPVATMNVVYGVPSDPGYDAKAQQLDVYQNAAATAKAPAPVLVYMHGGAWNHGQRPASWHGFRAWVAAGFSVVNVEYRMADEHFAPAAIQDVRCVLSWVKANAAQYHFDASRVVTYGTSAGGHLALLAAVLPAGNDIDLARCRDQPHVSAVLDFYGPYHLEPDAPGAFLSPSVKRWMGPSPQPSLLAMERSLSPSTYVRKGMAPVFIAYGDADPTVPPAADEALHGDLERLGVKNVVHRVAGGKHGGWTAEENVSVQLDSLHFLEVAGVIR